MNTIFKMNHYSVSLISRDESSSVKAILIFLIILGHNMVFTYLFEKYHVMEFLYNFHIQSFFILPFLYGSKCITKEKIINTFIRLYYPFILFTFISFIAYYVLYLNAKIEIINIFRMLFTGDVDLIKHFCGVQIFWFLPVMFSLLIIRDLYYYSNIWIKVLLLVLSCISLFLSLESMDYGYYYHIYNKINSFIPLGGFRAISYLILGALFRKIIEFRRFKDDFIVSLLLFLILSIIYFFNVNGIDNKIVTIILKIMFPIDFMWMLWNLRSFLSKFNYLSKQIGTQTFGMYVFHPYIGYICYFIIMKFFEIDWIYALLVQLIMFYGSFWIARKINNTHNLKKKLFPHNSSEFFSMFK